MNQYKITNIEKLYPDWYSEESNLSYDDQKWLWQHIPLPKEDEARLNEIKSHKIVFVNGIVNGGYKRRKNLHKYYSKPKLILKLKCCDYLTPPIVIASYLEQLFIGCNTYDGHFLHLAQHYTPKTINSIIAEISKAEMRGDITIKNPAAYFTSIIKKRKMRKKFRNANGGYKHNNVNPN